MSSPFELLQGRDKCEGQLLLHQEGDVVSLLATVTLSLAQWQHKHWTACEDVVHSFVRGGMRAATTHAVIGTETQDRCAAPDMRHGQTKELCVQPSQYDTSSLEVNSWTRSLSLQPSHSLLLPQPHRNHTATTPAVSPTFSCPVPVAAPSPLCSTHCPPGLIHPQVQLPRPLAAAAPHCWGSLRGPHGTVCG